jgi:hypothetical protein
VLAKTLAQCLLQRIGRIARMGMPTESAVTWPDEAAQLVGKCCALLRVGRRGVPHARAMLIKDRKDQWDVSMPLCEQLDPRRSLRMPGRCSRAVDQRIPAQGIGCGEKTLQPD